MPHPTPNVGLPIKFSPAEQTRLRQWECAHGTPQQVALRRRIIVGVMAGEDNVQKIAGARTKLEQIKPAPQSRTHLCITSLSVTVRHHSGA